MSHPAVAVNDVIQIAPHADVRDLFHGKLAIVDQVRAWGVRAYIDTFEGDAYLRLVWGTFEVIGPAAFLPAEAPAQEDEHE